MAGSYVLIVDRSDGRVICINSDRSDGSYVLIVDRSDGSYVLTVNRSDGSYVLIVDRSDGRVICINSEQVRYWSDGS